ncbi:MAG: polysaccharide biosynthesis/export family protein [Lentisphaeria bacterium]|nr:polysaccharide biosynthesis/export family protein [Lentisphaeria bacterium]
MSGRDLLHFLFLSVLLLCVLPLNGCKSVYENLPDASTIMLEESKVTQEEITRREDRLREISAKPYPDYYIDAGDIFTIKVYNNPDLDVVSPVTPDGYIAMMFVGQIKIGGLTIPQAVERVQEALSKYIKNPVVGILPTEIKSQTATISGAVVKTGVYSVHGNVTLADLFAYAGGGESRLFDGKVLDSYDFKNSYLVRGMDILPVDFTEAIVRGNPLHNIRMQKGDYVHIAARTEKMVAVFGEVMTPRFQLWNAGMGLLEAISNAGGLRDEHWESAVIMRGGMGNLKFYRADLQAILQGAKPNVPLEAGDIVYIPKDSISGYNVFVKKLLPTAQLLNAFMMPVLWGKSLSE